MSKSKKITIQDVAARAGVSGATVSYIISGRRGESSRISDITRKRVLEAANALGYTPNMTARNLRRQRTDRICMVIPSLTAPTSALNAQVVQDYAEKNGYFLVLSNAGTIERELQVFNALRQGLADGAIFHGARHLNAQHFRQLADLGIAVLVYGKAIDPQGFDVVNINEAEGQAQVVDYVIAKGYSRIAIMSDHSNLLEAERTSTYLRLLQQRGIMIDHRFVKTEARSRPDAFKLTQELLNQSETPDIVLCATDKIAVNVLTAARNADMRIPEDIAVLGIGNIPESEVTRPPLTTLGEKNRDYGQYIPLLFDRLAGKVGKQGIAHHIHWELIERGSV